MAEIHVQTKKQNSNMTWVWILIVLLVIAAVAYYLISRNKASEVNTTDTNTTSFIQLPQQSRLLGV